MAVTYRTIDGFPKGRWHRGEFFGITKLKCAWDDVDDLLLEIDGSPAWPADYAFGPTAAVAYEANVEPFAVQTNHGTSLTDYNHAMVTVKYTTRGPQWVANHGSIIETYGAAAMVLQVAENTLYWNVNRTRPLNPNEIENPVHYIQEWRIRWEDIPVSPPSYWAAVIGSSLLGCCNSNIATAFTSTRTFAAETLRFTPPTITTTYGIGKVARQTVTLGLQYKPSGWNNFWDTQLGWRPVYYANGNQHKAYTPATFPSRT